MNNIAPQERFSRDAVIEFDDGKELTVKDAELSPLAARIASEYRTDTVSPSMLTGTLLVGEFLVLLGIAITILFLYVGVDLSVPGDFPAHYLATATMGSGAFVILLQLMDGYQTRALR
ncbi:MAG: undecaprenyl-phosphate glucose phosphotransferase, partial [Pseudomonadota bacterium]